MAHPPVIIVDEHDTVVGEALLQEAWDKQLIHRIVLVLLRNDSGDLLIQRRSGSMRLYPNRWDTSASGHVDDGHSYLEAAQLEIEEELGIRTQLPLQEIAHFYTDEPYPGIGIVKRFVKIYSASITELTFQSTPEVSETKWVSADEIAHIVAQGQAAAGLSLAYRYVLARQQVIA